MKLSTKTLLCLCLLCGFCGCHQSPTAPQVEYSQEEVDEISQALADHDFDE